MTEELIRCHGCDCMEGQLHRYGCDVETCPFCLNQLVGCKCSTEFFLDKRVYEVHPEKASFEYDRMVRRLGTKGMTKTTKKEKAEWLAQCVEKSRIPYVVVPCLCTLCGRLWPHMFDESDEDWMKYVVPELQDKILCFDCWEQQKWMFPDGWRQAKGGTE